MAKVSRRYATARGNVDRERHYTLADALQLVKENATAKFNESIDVAINLGVDAKKSDQVVRGSVVLPQGTGKTNHSAHLWGAAYGILFTVLLEPAVLGHFTQTLLGLGSP